MLDIKFIRENKDVVQAGAKKKHVNVNIDDLIVLDDKRKETLTLIEKKRGEQNAISTKMPSASPEERQKMIADMTVVKESLQKEEEALKEIMKAWQDAMLRVPNIPDMSVPDGNDDKDNKEVKVWGEKPNFAFEPKDHVEIMTRLKMLDIERGTKVHGFRGYFLTGDGARLSFAIWNYALDFFSARKFIPVIAPALVRRVNFFGTGFFPGEEENIYTNQDGDSFAGTAEVALMGMHSEEVLNQETFPIRYLGFSPCYRREAGAHAKDVKGLIRVHEFYKFEQVILCEASHETSVTLHEELNRNTEEFIESLGIPYHTVLNCGGDLGLGQVKKYDIELWVPKENTYREISSASYFHDFQTRRLNIRYKDKDGKMRYTHSLNCTAIPTPRILVSLIENYQQADGSIKIPEVLIPYLHKEIIK